MGRARFLGIAASVLLGACSLFVPFAEYDKDYGTTSPSSDGGGTTDGPSSDAPIGSDAPIDAPACTDTTTDQNCGACGHDCRGQKCNFSHCALESIVSLANTDVTAIALDSTQLYISGKYLGAGTVARVSKSNNSDYSVIASLLGDPVFLTVHGNNLYFTRKGANPGVVRLPADGDSGAADAAIATVLVNGQTSPFAIAASDSAVFWTNSPTGGDVWRVQADGGADASVVAAPQSAVSIAVDASFIYWTVSGTDGKIMRAGHDGSGATAIVPNAPWANGIALDDDTIYWTSTPTATGPGSVLSKSKTGGAGKTLADNIVNAPGRIATDGVHVYFTASGNIYRVSKAGGDLLDLVALTGENLDIAVDDTYCYFVDKKLLSSEHQVYRVAK